MKDTPLILRIEEARKILVDAVNAVIKEQNLPCFLIEPIIAEVHASISDGVRRERESALMQVAQEATEGGEDNESGV